MQKKQNGENIQNIPADQQKIRLLALDIDGTLFNTDGTITPASIAAIRRAQQKGVIVVLASGRDYDGIPWNQLSGIDLQYVITTNGSAVYEVGDKKCLYEECLEPEKMVPVVQYLLEKEVYISVFIDGVNYTPIAAFPYVEHLGVPEYVKTVLKENRNGIEDLAYYIKKEHAKIQKVTLNFQQLPDGSFFGSMSGFHGSGWRICQSGIYKAWSEQGIWCSIFNGLSWNCHGRCHGDRR